MKKSVLIVIDMQRYFLNSKEHGYFPAAKRIVPNIINLILHYRNLKMPVIFTRHAHKKDGSDLGILAKWWSEMPIDGNKESEIDQSIPVEKDDIIIRKTRYSAFYGTKLDKILKSFHAKEIVVCGVMTNVCCESTAREAFFKDYMVKFVSDATAAKNKRMHNASILNLSYAFAKILKTKEIIRLS